MSHWVNVEFNYEPRLATLYVSNRLLYRLIQRNLIDVARDATPEEMEKVVLDLIEEIRPEYGGGFLYSIKFNPCPPRWEFTYFHYKFDPVKDFYKPPVISLDPNATDEESQPIVE